jgi:hypothetical protein
MWLSWQSRAVGPSTHHQEIIMKTAPTMIMAAVIMAAMTALALTAGEASARQLQHHQVREYQTHQYAPPANEYESLSQGRQSNPNPDRQLYVPELPF